MRLSAWSYRWIIKVKRNPDLTFEQLDAIIKVLKIFQVALRDGKIQEQFEKQVITAYPKKSNTITSTRD